LRTGAKGRACDGKERSEKQCFAGGSHRRNSTPPVREFSAGVGTRQTLSSVPSPV
jgi:hypothetical protein